MSGTGATTDRLVCPVHKVTLRLTASPRNLYCEGYMADQACNRIYSPDEAEPHVCNTVGRDLTRWMCPECGQVWVPELVRWL